MAGPEQLAERGVLTRAPKTWVPKQVLITPSARQWPLATRTAERAAALGAEIVELTADRITGLACSAWTTAAARGRASASTRCRSPGASRAAPRRWASGSRRCAGARRPASRSG